MSSPFGAGGALISVPHRVCHPSDERTNLCDRSSGAHADSLARDLSDRGISSVVTGPLTHRSTGDENRKVMRGSSWRSALASHAQSGKFGFLVDVHSYPDTWYGHTGVVILLPVMPYSQDSVLAQWLRDTVFRHQKVTILRGGAENDIINTLHNHLPAVLVEQKDPSP